MISTARFCKCVSRGDRERNGWLENGTTQRLRYVRGASPTRKTKPQMVVCLLAALAALVLATPARQGFRDRFLRALVVFGLALFLITELLSPFSLVRPVPLIICWTVIFAAALVCIIRAR